MVRWKNAPLVASALIAMSLSAFGQSEVSAGEIRGTVKDPDQAAVSGARVTLTDQRTHSKTTVATNNQGFYVFASLQPGTFVVEVEENGFKNSQSPLLRVEGGATVAFDVLLVLAELGESVTVLADAENAYRVENVAAGGPLGTTPILNIPFSINVISRQLIDDTQSRNVKDAVKYLPLASFQEMQGPEVIRPATRGMQGSNMQNARKDGMGIAVTTPSALEEYEQIEVVSGLGGQFYGPTNPSGVFNFATKRPTETQFREIELAYEGTTVATVHADLGGRVLDVEGDRLSGLASAAIHRPGPGEIGSRGRGSLKRQNHGDRGKHQRLHWRILLFWSIALRRDRFIHESAGRALQ